MSDIMVPMGDDWGLIGCVEQDSNIVIYSIVYWIGCLGFLKSSKNIYEKSIVLKRREDGRKMTIGNKKCMKLKAPRHPIG